MRKIYIVIFIASVVLGLGIVLAYKQPSESNPMQGMANSQMLEHSGLSANIDSYDFGTISMQNGKVNKTFTVTNTTDQNINLKKLYSSCMCTTAAINISGNQFGPFGMPGMGVEQELNQVLAAHQQAQITATFDPNAHGPSGVGEIERSITLEGNNGKLLVINFKANVTP